MARFYLVTMACVDPHAILGVPEGVDERELTAAYRAQAKLWHPDRGGGEEAARRMAEINAAYDLLRAGIAPHAHAARPREAAQRARELAARSRSGARSGPSCSTRSPSPRRSGS